MGTKYSSQSAVNFDSSSPPDDGTTVAANKVTWSTIKTKLASPVKGLGDAINSALVTALDTSARAVSSPDSAIATDHWKTLQVTGTTTITLSDAATMAAGYVVTIANTGVATVTVARATVGDTINGAAANVTLPAKSAATFAVNAAANGYNVLHAHGVSLGVFNAQSSSLMNGVVNLSPGSGNAALQMASWDLLKYDNTGDLHLGGYTAAQFTTLGLYTGGTLRAKLTATGGLQSTWVPRTNLTYTPTDTTPSVANTGFLSISNAGPVTITGFDDGEAGQVIVLFFNDANTTVNRSTCVLSGGVNFVSSSNDILTLIKVGSVWVEMSRGVNA